MNDAIPDLEPQCGSWIIEHVETGKALIEVFSRREVERHVTNCSDQIKVHTALQWLGKVNAQIKFEASPA